MRGLKRRGAGDLDLAIEVRRPVLERLELADQLAELLALAKVVERHGRSAGCNSDQLGRGSGAARVQRSGQRRPAAVHLTDYGVGVERDIVEGQPRGPGVVGQGDILNLGG